MRHDGSVARLGDPWSNPKRMHGRESVWQGSHLWEEVNPQYVIDFLDGYRSHPEAHKVNSDLLGGIRPVPRSRERTHELDRRARPAAVGGRGRPCPPRRGGGENAQAQRPGTAPRSVLHRAGSCPPRDEAIDLDESAWNAALAEARRAYREDAGRNRRRTQPDVPNGPAIRRIRPNTRGVLFLYLLDPGQAGEDSGLDEQGPPIVGFAVSFPQSRSAVRVDYAVNNILWEQEFGASE